MSEITDYVRDWVLIIECPKCNAPQQDFDGFGFINCPTCNHCTHPAGTCEPDGSMTCDICKKVVK